MFGGLAFLICGRMAISASGQGGVLVHVDPGRSGDLVATTRAATAVMQGREMPGWLRVNPEDLASDDDLSGWVKSASDMRGRCRQSSPRRTSRRSRRPLCAAFCAPRAVACHSQRARSRCRSTCSDGSTERTSGPRGRVMVRGRGGSSGAAGVSRARWWQAARTSASVCFGVRLRARASHGKVTRPRLIELGPLVRYQRHDEPSHPRSLAHRGRHAIRIRAIRRGNPKSATTNRQPLTCREPHA